MVKELSADRRLENPTKTELAKSLGISRASLYYEPTLPQKDWLLKTRIEQTPHEHPSYGHKRLAPALQVNKKRIQPVMKLFGIKPYRGRGKKLRKARDLGQIAAPYQNWLLLITFPEQPGYCLGFRFYLHSISRQVCLPGYNY